MRPAQGKGWAIGVAWLALLVATGCSGAKVTTKASSELPKYRVQRVAVLPFDTLATPQATQSTAAGFQVPQGAKGSYATISPRPPHELPARSTVGVPPSAAEKVTQVLGNRLRSRTALVVLSSDESGRALHEVEGKDGGKDIAAMAPKAAARLSVDAVVIGRVLVYQERVGSRMGADPPAAVGFEVRLVAADGALLWEGNYFERQQPVTADLAGFFIHGLGFVTADELLHYGADELAKAFPFGQATGGQ
ncbi:MAG TPA: hypothetical protein VLE03_05800 [Nitrospiraceae bacterium]|nr:hypothetical protein [Nitrospiraceae bacterium]